MGVPRGLGARYDGGTPHTAGGPTRFEDEMTTETTAIHFDMGDSPHEIPPLYLPRDLPMSSASVRIATHVYPYFGRHQHRKWTCILESPAGGVLTGRDKVRHPFTVTPPLRHGG